LFTRELVARASGRVARRLARMLPAIPTTGQFVLEIIRLAREYMVFGST
jgi:hypothetical protein